MGTTIVEVPVRILASERNQPGIMLLPGVEVGNPCTPLTVSGMAPGYSAEVAPSLVASSPAGESDHLPFGAAARCEALVEEIESRTTAVREAAPPEKTRSAFRDNRVHSRFEFIHEGVLAGYVKYELRGAHVMLLETVVLPRFRETDPEVEPILIRRVMLEAHRRRLTLAPVCTAVTDSLTEYPQYLALIPASQRRRTMAGQTWGGANRTAGV